jgi:hypothetical protein
VTCCLPAEISTTPSGFEDAALLAAYLLGEPVTMHLIAGLVAVFLGIWIAATDANKP